jgi:hypothetical protein
VTSAGLADSHRPLQRTSHSLPRPSPRCFPDLPRSLNRVRPPPSASLRRWPEAGGLRGSRSSFQLGRIPPDEASDDTILGRESSPVARIVQVWIAITPCACSPGAAHSSSLVLLLGITVTYLEGRQAAEASRLFSILAKRVVRSLRVKVHWKGEAVSSYRRSNASSRCSSSLRDLKSLGVSTFL